MGLGLAMKVTMRDIAKKANVSVATVSRALSGTGYIKEDTLELVIKACKELGYAPIIRNIESKSNSKIIGVITADLKNDFNVHVINGITGFAEKYGYSVIVYDQQEQSQRAFEALSVFKKIPLTGIVLTPVMDTTDLGFDYLKELEKLKLPIVLVDRDLKYTNYDGVYLDNVEGAYLATMALISAGHKKIATITGTMSSLTGRDRLSGFQKAVQFQKLNIKQEYIRSGGFTVEKSYDATMELLKLPDPPSAVFVANSVMMEGFIKAVKDLGLKIPDDISVISFDDLPGYIELSGFSVVMQPMREMGEKAMEILLERICEPLHGQKGGIRLILNLVLRLRGSEKLIKK